eukprot:1152641-Pelagomonas_calceolata.AAC.8
MLRRHSADWRSSCAAVGGPSNMELGVVACCKHFSRAPTRGSECIVGVKQATWRRNGAVVGSSRGGPLARSGDGGRAAKTVVIGCK